MATDNTQASNGVEKGCLDKIYSEVSECVYSDWANIAGETTIETGPVQKASHKKTDVVNVRRSPQKDKAVEKLPKRFKTVLE